MQEILRTKSITVNETVKYQVLNQTFMQKSDDMVQSLLRDAENDVQVALIRLTSYIENAGAEPRNKDELQQAKDKLEKMVKH